MSVTASAGDGTVTLTPAVNVAPFVSATTGTRALNALATSGSETVIVSSGCSLAIGTHATGLLTTTPLTISFESTISAGVTASDGNPSNCAAFADTSYHFIPFPSLIPATNGTCSYGFTGIFTEGAP